MPIFYHVSTDIAHTGIFTPRIPNDRYPDEDATTPRVSVSPSIADALTAIPHGGSQLSELLEHLHGYIKVFKIDTDKLGIHSSDIIGAQDLYNDGRVPDAENTNEIWITVPFVVVPADQEIIIISDWDEESYDVIPAHIYTKADVTHEGDYLACYMDEYGKNVPCCIRISNLTYQSTKLTKNDVRTLYFDDCYGLDDWLELKDTYKLPIEPYEHNGTLYIRATDTIDLSNTVVNYVKNYYI